MREFFALALLLLAARPSESMEKPQEDVPLAVHPLRASGGSASGSGRVTGGSPQTQADDVQLFASLPCPGKHCPTKAALEVPDASPLSFKTHPRISLGADLWQNKWCTEKGAWHQEINAHSSIFLHGTNGFAVAQSARYTGLRMVGLNQLTKVGLAAVGGEGVARGEQYDSNGDYLFVTHPTLLPSIIPPLAYADRAVTTFFVPRRSPPLSVSGEKKASPLQTWLASLSEQQYAMYRRLSLIPVVMLVTMGENAQVSGVKGSSIPGERILTCGDIQALGVGASYTFDETSMDEIPKDSLKPLHTAEENMALLRSVIGHYSKHTVTSMPVDELVTNLAKCKGVNKKLTKSLHRMFRPQRVKELVTLETVVEKMQKPQE